jgi:hypothetical protein
MASTWGLSWGGDAGAWLTSWSSTFVPPQPPPVDDTPTPAGRKTKRRYYVEIDGQPFEVADVHHAQALLERARETAKAHAEQLALAIVPKTRKVGKRPVALKTPSISSPDPELREVIQSARVAINQVYRDASIDTELALLLARRLADEDEEEALLLLM